MALRKQNHVDFADVSADLRLLDDSKEEKITFANRAPNSSDKGRVWINYTGAAGARLYFRHQTTGAWTATAA